MSVSDILDKRVRVYRNLNKKDHFSIKSATSEDYGRVIGYGQVVVLRDVVFSVSESGRRRVIENRQKNVHAYALGFVVFVGDEIYVPSGMVRLTYNPYENDSFFEVGTGKKVSSADACVCVGSGIWCKNVVYKNE